MSEEFVEDHTGAHYLDILRRLHIQLRPRSYLEIGSRSGDSLSLSRCPSIAIDPSFALPNADLLNTQPATLFFRMTSDDFFRDYKTTALLNGPIDLAFLDGMHRCEYLLRDFVNAERCCNVTSLVALHDCLPLDLPMTNRTEGAEPASHPTRHGWWTGDVWKTALYLKRTRPDLDVTAIDAQPTGLILITNLNPDAYKPSFDYIGALHTMRQYDLRKLTIRGLFNEMQMLPASVLSTEEKVTSRFHLG